MRYIVRFGLIVLAAVAVAIVGILMLPGTRIAQIAATQLSAQTGRDVEIGGDTSVTLLPTLGVKTGAVRVASADWATEGPLLEADSLAIGLNLPALFTGTIKLSTLDFQAPQIVLETNETGETNWDLFGSGTAEAAPAPESAEDSSTGFALSIDHAVIRNASVLYVDRSTGTRQQVQQLDLEVNLPGAGEHIQFDIAATPFAERISATGEIASLDSLITGSMTPLSVTLSVAESTVSLAGTVSLDPQAALQVDATLPDAGVLLRAAGLTPTDLNLPPNFAPNLRLASELSFDGTRLALRNLNGTVNGNTVLGDVDVVLTDALPQIAAQLDVNLTSVGGLMHLAGQAPETFSLAPDFDAAVTGSTVLQWAGEDISATLNDLNATIAGTTLSGRADIALASGAPKINAVLDIASPNVAPLAAMLGQPLSSFGLAPSADPSVSGQVDLRSADGVHQADLKGLTAALAGAKASGTVTVLVQNNTPKVTGHLNANVPSTASLMSAIGQNVPDLPRGFGQNVQFKSGLSLDGSGLSLSNMTVSLDHNTVNGSVALRLGSVPYVTAALSAGALDFSALAPEVTEEDSPSSAGWSTDPIDASALGLINGSVSISAQSIDLGLTQLGATALTATIDNSRAVLDLSQLQAFGGGLTGQIVANNRSGFSTRVALAMSQISLHEVLDTFADIDAIAGRATGAVNVLGVGASVDAIMRSLAGDLTLQVPQGTIAGIDFEGLIQQGNPNARDTEYSDVQATASIQNGVARNADLSGRTGRFRAKGDGYVDLGAQTLDYLLTPIVENAGSKGEIALPVRIKGPWSSPTIRPDLEAALNLENERKKLEEQARQELEREKEKLRQQAQEEADKLKAQVEAEAKKLEAQARAKAEAAAKRAAQKAAEKLKLDQASQKALEDAAREALEREVGGALKGLLGGN